MSDLDQLTQSLARNLKRWRGERGFTLDALAARAGVSRGMIIQIEQARTNPSVGTTVKLADARVRTRLFDLDDHAPAHARPGCERGFTLDALAPPALEVTRERLGELIEVRHIPSNIMDDRVQNIALGCGVPTRAPDCTARPR